MIVQVVLHPRGVKQGQKRQTFDVTFGAQVIVESSLDPEHDAARALLGMGFSGPFETLDPETGRVRMMFGSIAETAKWRIAELGGGRLRRVRWRPREFPVAASLGRQEAEPDDTE